MALTPEEIEGRQFPVVSHGYDREQVDRYLAEVAASFRYAVHHLLPGVEPVVHTSSATPPAAADSFDRLGDEVAEILRSAQRMGDAVKAEAEADAAEIRAQADLALDDARQAAGRDRDQAKRVLLRAQDQVDAILAEAEAQAHERLLRADVEAEERTEHLVARSRRQAEQVLRAERAAVERLQAVRAEIDSAITRLAGSETNPVVDLTSGEAIVRVGDVPLPDGSHQRRPDPLPSPPDLPTASVAAMRNDTDSVEAPADRRDHDPVRRMIRAAVVRAVANPVDAGDPAERWSGDDRRSSTPKQWSGEDRRSGSPEASGTPRAAEG